MVIYNEMLPKAYFGHRNLTKGTVLKYLCNLKYERESKEPVSTDDIVAHTGLPSGYVKQRIRRWVLWGYILVEYIPARKYRTLYYKIAAKGEKFLADAPEAVLAKYQAKIDAAEAKLYKAGGIKGLFS